MKKLLFFFVMFFMGLAMVFAQTPISPMTYQSVVRNAQNQLVINQSGIGATVIVWNADGTAKQYEETHTGLSTNANGLLTLMVGNGTVAEGTWAGIDWSAASIQMVISYGSETITSERAPVSAVPFAIQAGNVTPQVNADWTEDDATNAAYILHKPDLSVYATQTKLHADSTALHTALKDTAAAIRGSMNTMVTTTTDNLQANIDTTSQHVRAALADTATAIRGSFPAVNDATLTIQKNGTDVGTFTANQSTAGTINITVPTTVAELTDANDYATKAGNNPFTGNNTFTGTNAFSGTVTVPQAMNQTTLAYTNDEMQAVAYKDLKFVVDSLLSSIRSLRHDLDSVGALVAASQTAPVFTGISTTSHTYSIDIEFSISIGGSPLTSIEYCYSTTNDIASATCVTETGNSYTFTGLTANTPYYLWVKATNAIGTTVSNVQEVRTSYEKPRITSMSASSVSGERAINVSGNMNLQGAPEAVLTLYIGNGSEGSMDAYEQHSFTVSGTSFNVEHIVVSKQGTTLYVIGQLDNGGDSKSDFRNTSVALPLTAPTLGETMVISNVTTHSMDIAVALINTGGAASLTEQKVCYVIHGQTDTTCQDLTLVNDTLKASLSGLTNGEDYDLKVRVSNGSAATIDSSCATPSGISLIITPSQTGDLYLCGSTDTKAVTYIATITGDDAHIADYTYKWSVKTHLSSALFVDSTAVTSNTLTVNYPYVNYDNMWFSVQCVAYRNDNLHFKDSVVLASTVRVKLVNSYSGYYMTMYSDHTNSTVKVMSVAGIETASWRDETDAEKYTYKTTGTYTLDEGTYHIVLTSTYGCTKTIEDLVVTSTPPKTYCSGAAANSNEHTYSGGIDSVRDDDGLHGGTSHWYGVTEMNGYCVMKENLRAQYSPSTGNLMAVYNIDVTNTLSKSVNKATSKYNWCAAVDTFYAAGSAPEIVTSQNTVGTSWAVTLPSGFRRGACPAGWHIPTKAEWTQILNGYTNLQLAEGSSWSAFNGTSNTGGDYQNQDRNISGFSAIPNSGNSYYYWWTATAPTTASAYATVYHINCNKSNPEPYDYANKGNNWSVRCVRDY